MRQARPQKIALQNAAKRGPGRPPHEPTEQNRKTVQAMAGYAITHEEIAIVLGITKDTLYKYYREELDRGPVLAAAQVGQSLFDIATKRVASKDGAGRLPLPGAVAAIMWWEKSRRGMRETVRQETTGPDGGPIQNSYTIALSRLSDDQLAVLEQIAGSLTAPIGNPGGEDPA